MQRGTNGIDRLSVHGLCDGISFYMDLDTVISNLSDKSLSAAVGHGHSAQNNRKLKPCSYPLQNPPKPESIPRNVGGLQSESGKEAFGALRRKFLLAEAGETESAGRKSYNRLSKINSSVLSRLIILIPGS